jgi:hypothetical protein
MPWEIDVTDEFVQWYRDPAERETDDIDAAAE